MNNELLIKKIIDIKEDILFAIKKYLNPDLFYIDDYSNELEFKIGVKAHKPNGLTKFLNKLKNFGDTVDTYNNTVDLKFNNDKKVLDSICYKGYEFKIICIIETAPDLNWDNCNELELFHLKLNIQPVDKKCKVKILNFFEIKYLEYIAFKYLNNVMIIADDLSLNIYNKIYWDQLKNVQTNDVCNDYLDLSRKRNDPTYFLLTRSSVPCMNEKKSLPIYYIIFRKVISFLLNKPSRIISLLKG